VLEPRVTSSGRMAWRLRSMEIHIFKYVIIFTATWFREIDLDLKPI
jgi:hypothetical protein